MSASTSTVIEHEVGPTGLIAIRLHSSSVRLRGVDGTAVRVTDPTGSLERSVRIERAPGSLSIRATHTDRSFSIGRASLDIVAGRHVPDLEIEVPRGATVVIETASGDVAVDGLTGDQRYRTASGEIDLRDVAGQLALDGVSGDVAMQIAGPSSIAARTVSGDLRIRGDHDLAASRIATTSGDVWLEGRFTGPGPFSIETVSGDTTLVPGGGVRLDDQVGDRRRPLGRPVHVRRWAWRADRGRPRRRPDARDPLALRRCPDRRSEPVRSVDGRDRGCGAPWRRRPPWPPWRPRRRPRRTAPESPQARRAERAAERLDGHPRGAGAWRDRRRRGVPPTRGARRQRAPEPEA